MPIENVLAQVYNKDIINQANGGIKNMQVLRGTKREVTLMLWNEQLEKAKKRLEESKEWYEEYKDGHGKQWIEEDEKKVEEI